MNDTHHDRPEGFQRVAARLAELKHPHAPQFLGTAARTAQEAADVLGVSLGQIAKSVIFRRKSDDVAVPALLFQQISPAPVGQASLG